MEFTYKRQGRSTATAAVVIAIWITLIAAYVFLDAALWVLAVFALFTLPAVVDFARDPESGMVLTERHLRWYSGARAAEIDVSEIERIRMDTRLDFSVRVTVILENGRKIRVPFESTPAHVQLEAALKARGIKTERFHFQLMQ